MTTEPGSSDRIHIEELEIFARIGVPEAERATPQRLVANITLWPKRDFHDLADDVERTVNYSALSEETKKFVGQRCDRLLETLAGQLAAHLLARFAIRQIDIELRKFVLPDAQYVSVAVSRRSADL